MNGRKIVLYYAWSRPGEASAPLEVIEDRFPALFESRRMGYPKFEEFSDPSQFDQSIVGFLDHIMKHNFTAFVELAETLTGQPVVQIERGADDGSLTTLDGGVLEGADTLIIISFDSFRTGQTASSAEVSIPYNLHAHLPQLDRIGEAVGKLDVLARQKIDLAAPPHPFT